MFAGDEAAKRAWNEWSARSSLDRASWEEVRLLATAARRMRDLDPGSSLSRRLDGVRRFVWTNTQMTLNGTRPLLAKFCESNVRLMLIKGAARLALAPQLAADRLLRDIDVLVHPDDWSKALELADQNGWRDPRWPNLTTEIFPYHHGVEIQDDRRCTIDLHHLALYVSRNAGDDDALWERARPVTLRGLKMFAPSPADEVLIAIVHGLLYAGGGDPNADWILDIVPLIRSGDVDWDILEAETHARHLVPNIASGLLLGIEHFNLPIPSAMFNRLLSLVREPFISDFRSFATSYRPSDTWHLERVKAAAALRALSAARRTKTRTDSRVRLAPVAGRTPQQGTRVNKTLLSKIGLDQFSARFRKLIRARPLQETLSCSVELGEITAAAQPVRCVALANVEATALVTLKISLHVEECAGSGPAVLEVTAPGLILKHWRAPRPGANDLIIQMPAALLAMRRIEHIELRASQASLPVPFKDVIARWQILHNPSDICVDHRRLFDPVWYQRKQLIGGTSDEVLWDYLEAGWLDGRNPSARFDGNKYLRDHPDVAAAGINPLLHYLRSGLEFDLP